MMQKQDRSVLWIEKGATISSHGREYVVVALADINLVLAKEIGSGEKVLLKIGDLEPPRPSKVASWNPSSNAISKLFRQKIG
jgi:putative transposase